MAHIRLVHWNDDEARPRAALLAELGHTVDASTIDRAALRRLQAETPDAVVIDLSRQPMQGRDLGLHLRKTKATRQLPLVFVAGAPAKVERVRADLPDAVYTTWEDIETDLPLAVSEAPADPVVPESVFDPYRGRSLAEKLGVKAGTTVALVGAPSNFEHSLAPLPDAVAVRPSGRGNRDLTIWFVRRRRDLEARVESMVRWAVGGGLWIAWPKRTSGVNSDVTLNAVRAVGLEAGLVDFKICSIDDTWSALRFSKR